MDESGQSKSKSEHFKPLSIYSRMMACEQKAGLEQPEKSPNPFINFKIEILNNCMKKRKFDESSPDEGYETPVKKPFSPNVLSPDLGCCMDFYSPPARQDSVSPLAISKPALLDEPHALKTEIKETESSQLHSEHVECGSKTEPGVDKQTMPHSLKCEKVLLNQASDFDCDVDDILCLNPIGTFSIDGFADNVESCGSPTSNTFKTKPVLTVAQGQELDRGDVLVKEKQEETYLDVEHEEEVKGYFSMSYLKDLKLRQNPSQSVKPQLLPATSSPLLRIGEVKAPEDEKCNPEPSSKPGQKQALVSGQQVSFTITDLCPIVSEPWLESVNSADEPLEGDVEEEWNIGLPTFESSIVQSVNVKLDASSEQSSQVSAETGGGIGSVMEVITLSEWQATLIRDKTFWDDSYEATLLPPVQVKSVVVKPRQLISIDPANVVKPRQPISIEPANVVKPRQPISIEPANVVKPRQPTSIEPANVVKPRQLISIEPANVVKPRQLISFEPAKCYQRPVVFKREVDWEKEKREYVHLVTRHMEENPSPVQNVMTELLNLMTRVADQKPDVNGKKWQHPSDFTRRNYQRRLGPKLSLAKWQAKNIISYKRFAVVPKIFERSSCP